MSIAESLRKAHPNGQRVELIRMTDPYQSILKKGSRGTVNFIDDTGTVFINWDRGSRLGCVYGEDEFKVVKEENQ